MANAIPLLEGTAGSGGYLVPDNFNGLLFERGINRQSAVMGMPGLRVRRVGGKREKFTEYVGRPDRRDGGGRCRQAGDRRRVRRGHAATSSRPRRS